jgi:hypothetical protein
LAGLIYAFALYYRTRQFRDKSKFIVPALFLARFITVSLISFFLLSPLIKRITERTVRPVLVIAQDYTLSLQNAYGEDELIDIDASVRNISRELGVKYDVHEFSLGGEITTGFSDSFYLRSTNISTMLDYINNAYDSRELAAVILSSDGIYNEGANPDYFPIRTSAPIYTIALGDTTLKKDVWVQNIFHNSIAFPGDKIGIKTDISAKNAGGSNTELTLSEYGAGGQLIILGKKPVNINSDDYFTSFDFVIDIKSPGVKRYNLSVGRIADEASYKNNSRDFFVNVIDSKTDILIYANSPHPDITAIRDLLSSVQNNEIEIKFATDDAEVKKYDLVIFHNLPSARNNLNNILRDMQSEGIPALYFVGSQTNIPQFNRIQDMVTISNTAAATNDVQAILNRDFTLFNFEDMPGLRIDNFPPLSSPFGNFSSGPESAVLLRQKIRNINTDYPLLVVSTGGSRNTAVFNGVNFFKWKIYEYLQTRRNDISGALINQVVQYLTLKRDRSQWQVRIESNMFQENESIRFFGELYNDNYELVNEPEAFLKLTGPNRKEYDYVFSRTDDKYDINAGSFPAGDYEYTATTALSGNQYSNSGRFTIQSKDLELYDVIADHSVLSKLSARTNGEMFFISESDQLIKRLLDKDAKPVIYSSENNDYLLDFKFLFFLILFLLTIEWLVRKLQGSI